MSRMLRTNDCVPAGVLAQLSAGDVPSPGAAPSAQGLVPRPAARAHPLRELPEPRPEMGEHGPAEQRRAREAAQPSTPAAPPAEAHEREHRCAECEAGAPGGIRSTTEHEGGP